MKHTVTDLIAAYKFYSDKLEAVESETLSGYQLRTCDCGISQREFDNLKAEEINALQSKIDALQYFIDGFAKTVREDMEHLEQVCERVEREDKAERMRLARGIND